MKYFKVLLVLLISIITGYYASAQSNASINVLTLNSGIVNGNGYVQVDIGNSGPSTSIGVNKVRAQISIPSAIAIAAPNSEQSLPQGWTIMVNNGGTIQICNGSDIIPVNAVRTILIKIKAVSIGGPSTVSGVLSFGPGSGICTGPGSLAGDVTADNTSTSTIQVTGVCNLSASPSFTNVSCAGGSNGTASANVSGNTQAVTYSITGPTVNTTGASSGTFTSLSAGTYVIAYTSGGCSGSTNNIVVGTTPDVTAPVINTCASNQTVVAGTNGFANVPNFTSGVVASDNCSSVTITQSPLAGTTRPVGTHTITLTATDASGNSSTCTVSLTVSQGCNFTVADSIVGSRNACSGFGTSTANVSYSLATTSASGYVWTVSNPATMTIVSGQNSSSIAVHYSSTFISGTISVTVSSLCGANISRTTNLIIKKTPAVPTAILGPVTVCSYLNGSQATYSVSPVSGASFFRWTLPSNITLVSANTDSSSINVTFNSGFENGAILERTLKVKSVSDCGNSADKSVVLVGLKPATPASILIQPIQTNVCGARIYRYIAPVLPAASTTVTAATGYSWTLSGSLGANATLDSGTLSSRIMVVRFTSNAGSAAGDSVRLSYTSICGNSAQKVVKISNVVLGPPKAPTAIKIQPIQTNVCGARLYRYIAPSLPLASISNRPGTGWQWQFVGGLGINATIDSGSLTSQIVVMRFTSNSASVIGDSVKLYYTSDCGNGATKAAKLSNAALKTPNAPASITITPVQTNICGARIYRYTAPVLPAASLINGAATGYIWTLPSGPVGSTGTLDSGTVNSRIIRIIFTSNAVAPIGDSIRVLYTSDCGNSNYKAAKLSNTLLNAPMAPSAITASLVSDVCGARIYRYSAPALPTASTTAGLATGYNWVLPSGTIGATAVLDSGTTSGRVIKIKYTSNAAAGINDSIKVRYLSACGFSNYKAAKIAVLAKTGCPSRPLFVQSGKKTEPSIQAEVSMEAKVFPNPSTTSFKLQVITSGKEQIKVRVMDIMGRTYKVLNMMPGEILNFGSELRTGSYMVEIIQGKNRITKQVIKL